jgi:hypothetical protein
LNWCEEDGRSGWRETGAVSTSNFAAWDFWTKAARLVCAVEGRHADYVSALTDGVLDVGPLAIPLDVRAATMRHQTAGGASILGEIPIHAWREAMGLECAQTSVGFTRAREDGGPVFTIGVTPIVGDELRHVFLGGSDGVTWTEQQRTLSGQWVAAISRLLRHEGARGKLLVGIGDALKLHVFGTPAHMRVMQLVASRQYRAVGVYLALAVNADAAALRVANFAGWDAGRMMEAAAMAGPWPETFAVRIPRIRAALEREGW